MFWLLADESFPVIKAADDHVSSSTGGGECAEVTKCWSLALAPSSCKHSEYFVAVDQVALRCQAQRTDNM